MPILPFNSLVMPKSGGDGAKFATSSRFRSTTNSYLDEELSAFAVLVVFRLEKFHSTSTSVSSPFLQLRSSGSSGSSDAWFLSLTSLLLCEVVLIDLTQVACPN